MQKVAIVTDSIASLTPEIVKQYRLRIVPINIYFDGTVYRDGVDITPSEAYRLLEETPDLFATSAASAGEYLETYQELSAQFQAILCITLSSGLSTLCNTARLAKEEAKDKLPGTTIEVMDSKTAAGGEGLVALAAARAAAEGKDLAEVIKVAEVVRDRVRVIGLMKTVRHVYRTGRVPKIIARAASIINVKPIFTITDGVVRFAGLARTREHGVKRVLNIMRKRVGTRPVHVIVSHANVPDEGERLKERISAEFNCVELWLTDFSPVMGYATGRGTLAVAFYHES